MFSKTMAKSSCNAGKLQKKKKVSMKMIAATFPNAARDFVVHKVIIFLVEAL